MKIKSLIFMGLFVFVTSLSAENMHSHPAVSEPANAKPEASSVKAASALTWPGSCEIEIINHSYSDVVVNGVFDDGVSLQPFNVYSFGNAQYISLYYYGYCHDGMDLYIDTWYGKPVYAGYVNRYTTLRIVPSMYGSKETKVTLQTKK